MIDYTKAFTKEAVTGFDVGLREYMVKVYSYMAMALMVTAVAGFATVTFEPLTRLMFDFSPMGQVAGYSGFGFLVMLAPLFLGFYFFGNVARLDASKSQMLLWAYAALTGMSLSVLSFVYTGESIVRVFFICSSTFAAMSIYGYSTKRDLTAMGSFLIMGVFGLIITSLINIFIGSSMIYFMTSVLGLGIFIGLVAYDTQKLKSIYYSTNGGVMGQRMAVYGAFNLYLDFINLFVYMIRLLGVRKSD